MVNGKQVHVPLELANRLRPVLLRLGRELRRETHSLGVTGRQVSLLIEIRQSPGLGVRELASREGISAPGISVAIARLERAGLIERSPNAEDRRRQGLRLTAAGERVLRSVRSRRTAWLSARLERLTPEELAALEAALPPLARLLEEGPR